MTTVVGRRRRLLWVAGGEGALCSGAADSCIGPQVRRPSCAQEPPGPPPAAPEAAQARRGLPRAAPGHNFPSAPVGYSCFRQGRENWSRRPLGDAWSRRWPQLARSRLQRATMVATSRRGPPAGGGTRRWGPPGDAWSHWERLGMREITLGHPWATNPPLHQRRRPVAYRPNYI